MTQEDSESDARSGAMLVLRSKVWSWLLLSLWPVVIGAISATQMVAADDEASWPLAIRFALIDWGPWMILSPVVVWLAHSVQIGPHNKRWTVPLHLCGALLTAFAIEQVTNQAFELGWFDFQQTQAAAAATPTSATDQAAKTEQAKRSKGPPRGMGRFQSRLAIPIYFLIVAATHAMAFHRRSLERERRALLAEQRLTEARLMALQTQLQPHFFFNTLNAISSLVYTQPEAADEMICALSDLLRSVLAAADRREVALTEEMVFVEHYLGIQRLRFEDRLRICREIEPGLERAAVPTLILQPLVENAVIHGIAPQSGPGTVTLRAEKRAGRLRLTVSDTGRGNLDAARMPDGTLQFKEHVGLGNTRARLAALYRDEFSFTLAPAQEGGVQACLDLPLRMLPTT